MKRAAAVLSIVLFCCATYTGLVHASNTGNLADQPVQDISLQDDAFHGRGGRAFAEWWYFDAKFDNGYTAVIGVQILSFLLHGLVSVRTTIYNQGSSIVKNTEIYPLRDLNASTNNPSVAVAGKQLILGSFDNQTDCFVYNVTFETAQGSVCLHYTGTTEGWKRQQTTGDWWVVACPRANVTGTMTLGNMTMNVSGIGYHDHNWNVSPRIISHYGWFWGNCGSSDFTVTWAEVCSTRFTQSSIMVVSKIGGGFLSIPSDTVWFSAKDKKLDHLRLVPHFFNIETMTPQVFLTINMEVTSVDHTKFLGFINYWRYHVKCTGTIIMGGHMETVDGVSIIEYFRFR